MADRGISTAAQNIVINPASRDLLANTAAPLGVSIDKFKSTISTLTKFETKCLLVQLAELESRTNANLVTLGVPALGLYKANINANTGLMSKDGKFYANTATLTITNADHSDIKLGMVANVQITTGAALGSNTMVIQKSVGGTVTAGNFVPGFTYTIVNPGTTDFTLIGANASVAGNVFVANAVGSGTGTALGTKNEIIIGSNHAVSGNITFTVSTLSLGKYQASNWLLQKYGYINSDGTWAAKDDVDSNEIFLAATAIQDSIMYTFIREKYIELIQSGAIREGDSKEIIAGMLAVAYQYQDLGNPELKQNPTNPNGTINLENYSVGSRANVWRETGQTVDSRGRPGHVYFNGGRYSIHTLGADVPE